MRFALVAPALALFSLLAGCPESQPPSVPTEKPSPSGRGVACENELGLVCPAGQEDGCPRTTVHVCIAKNQAAGPACELEIAVVCTAGFVDACTLNPSPSKAHLCVAR